MRCAALLGLADLPAAERARAMEKIVKKMKDADASVRRAALGALCSTAHSENLREHVKVE